MGRCTTWITAGTDTPFCARKIIQLDSLPQKAFAWVCGLGQFNFYINGQKVGDHVLDPAWTDYRKKVLEVPFDITSYLKLGENEFSAEVGNGWYIADTKGGYFFHFPPFMPPNPNDYQPFDTELVLSVHAELDFADGKQMTLDTDESWQTAEHPIRCANCFGSEIRDARVKQDWTAARPAARSEALAKRAELQTIPPVRVIAEYPGKLLGTVNGRSVYDFGQNASGLLCFQARGQAGESICAYPAEKLQADGDVDQVAKNWMPIDVCETLILAEDDVWTSFDMAFTYVGCRYVAIAAAPENIKDVRLLAISSAGERAGTFDCDDERFLQIYDLVEKAVEANMLGVHTDCPTIERFAWQEENHLMAPAIMYMKQVKPHWEKFLADTRLAQHTAEDRFRDMEGKDFCPGDGLVPSQAPCYIPNVLPVPGMGSFYDIIGWGSSIILGTWWHYQFYGDLQIVRDNYEAGMRYLAHLKTKMTPEGFICHGLGDWGNPRGLFARENVETAFLYADAKVLASFADLLGRQKEKEELQAFAEQVRANYNERLLVTDPDTGGKKYDLWNPETKAADPAQTSQAALAMPLFWGLAPEECRDEIAAALRAQIEADGSLVTGEVGQPYIIQTLSEFGMNDLLCELILKPEHPSYYAFVLDGETTLGEYWEENPRSHCHDMMGHIAEWYYNGLAGIRPLKPGFSKVLIRPFLPASANRLDCTFESANGPISVHLRREEDTIRLEVEAAEGIETVIDRRWLD